MTRLRWSRWTAVWCLWSAWAAAQPAWAQRQKKDQPPPSQPVDWKVQLVGFGPKDSLQVIDAEERRFLARVEFPRTSVSVRGKADASFLAAGMYIRFRGAIADEKKGLLKDEVAELTVFTPRTENAVGVETYRGEDEAPAGTLEIAGQLTGLKKGKIQVQAGDATVNGKLADDVKVEINVGDLSIVAPGSELHIRGQLFEDNHIVCDLVEATLPEMSGPPAKKKRGRAPAKNKRGDAERE